MGGSVAFRFGAGGTGGLAIVLAVIALAGRGIRAALAAGARGADRGRLRGRLRLLAGLGRLVWLAGLVTRVAIVGVFFALGWLILLSASSGVRIFGLQAAWRRVI